MTRRTPFVFALICLLVLAGCTAGNIPGRHYGQTQEYYMEYGTVLRITPVNTGSELGAGVGATAGALMGAIVGSMVGRGAGSALSSVIGGVGGGLAGGYFGNEVAGTRGHEVMIQTDSNRVVSIIVDNATPVAIGQRVRVYINPQRSLIEPM